MNTYYCKCYSSKYYFIFFYAQWICNYSMYGMYVRMYDCNIQSQKARHITNNKKDIVLLFGVYNTHKIWTKMCEKTH